MPKSSAQLDSEIEQALAEMQGMLKRAGFDPAHARRLAGEGMGPHELSGRLAIPFGVGSLQHSHGIERERRNAYPDDLKPGDVVVRRDIKGRSKFVVSHTGKSGQFVQVYTRKVGGGSGIVTFDRSQLRMV